MPANAGSRLRKGLLQVSTETRKGRGVPWDGVAIVCAVLGLVLATIDVLGAFFVAPMVKGAGLSQGAVVEIGGSYVANKLLFSQKIFYFHVPVAIVSFAFVIIAAVFGVLYLRKGESKWDVRSVTSMEVGLVFILATMVSGDLWTRFEWGVWWVWEPRLTTYFILMLLVIAYFILRTAIDDPERRARSAAVFSVVAAVDAPISFFITRLIPSSIHPVVFRTDSGLSPDMLIPFLCGVFGMTCIGFAIWRLRLTLLEQRAEVESLKRRYEELDR